MNSSKSTLKKLVTALIVLAGIAILAFAYTNFSKSEDTTNKQTGSGTKVEAEEASVKDIVQNGKVYEGKILVLSGFIVKRPDKNYSFFDSQDSKQGLRLTVPSTINLDNFFDKDATTSKQVSVVGKLSNKPNDGVFLEVSEIK